MLEIIQDRVLEKRHKVEEAMTDALLRTCSKCKKEFFKTEGCNKIVCSCGNGKVVFVLLCFYSLLILMFVMFFDSDLLCV